MAENLKAIVRETVQLVEAEGFEAADSMLHEAMKKKLIRSDNIDYGALFVECFGHEEFAACRRNRRNPDRTVARVMEAAGGVTTSAFQAISGQIQYTMFLEGYESPDFTFTKMIPDKQTPFKSERYGGITNLGDVQEEVAEGQAYPVAGVGEDFQDSGLTIKRGFEVPVTREAIFFDRTGQLVEKTKNLGYSAGVAKEFRAIDCIIDENAGSTAALKGHRYRWLGNEIATYGDTSGNHSWDNLSASNTLTDVNSFNTIYTLMSALVDPFNTTIPFVTNPKHVCLAPQLAMTANMIIRSTQVRMTTPGYATSANPFQTESQNPMAFILPGLAVYSSPYFYQRLGTKTSWYVGDVGRAFINRVNFPMEVVTAPPNSLDEFHRDIVQNTKVSSMENFYTIEPRHMVKATVA